MQDADTENDVIATTAVITLEDANDTGDDIGTLINPIHTSVADLTVFTSAGSVFGNQFIREADGLIQINLDSNAALINLKLTEGALQDTDAANDVIGTTTVITLEDADDSGDSVGTLLNPIHTSVDDLTVFTNAGSVYGSQFIREANGLIQINLDSTAATINLKLTEGSLQDTDAANDVIATNAVITLEDTNDSGDDVGSLANPVHTSVDSLTVFTSCWYSLRQPIPPRGQRADSGGSRQQRCSDQPETDRRRPAGH
jgi:lysyl-tRNA synthetase class II